MVVTTTRRMLKRMCLVGNVGEPTSEDFNETPGSVIVAAVLVAAAATGSLAAAAPSETSSPWKTQQSLSPATGVAGRAAPAANAAGGAFAAWIEPDGIGGRAMQTARRDFGGAWGQPARVIDRPSAP